MSGVGDDDADLDLAAYGDRIADVYDEWHPGADRDPNVEATLRFLEARAGTGPALELGVGTGRFAIPLAARGVTVVGIDISERMVARLAAKPGGQNVSVVVGDFADVSAPGGPFALVYVVFNTFFGLKSQDAQVRCFTNVAAALRPGGLFVIEAPVPDPTRFDRGQRVHVEELVGDKTVLSVSLNNRVAQEVRTRHIVIEPEGITSYPVKLRYAWPSELDLMGRLASLDLVERYADWAGQPFTPQSPSHISVWKKPER